MNRIPMYGIMRCFLSFSSPDSAGVFLFAAVLLATLQYKHIYTYTRYFYT